MDSSWSLVNHPATSDGEAARLTGSLTLAGESFTATSGELHW